MSATVLIRQAYKRHRKLFFGFLNKRIPFVVKADWWDKKFYSGGIKSDASTISKHTDEVVSRYHYSSLELLLLKYFHNRGVNICDSCILDIGSGAGHWVDFYKKLGAKKLAAIDVSSIACAYLEERFGESLNIRCGKASEILKEEVKETYDLISAIGVMFHVVDDRECVETIKLARSALKPGGLFIVSGHFGYINGLNVQVDKSGVNKRLRSRWWWRKNIKIAGFASNDIFWNRAYLGLDWLTPEANLLFARK